MQSLRLAALTANVACAAADAYILCKERGNEGEAMMLAVATYFDQIKQFAASENLDPRPLPEANPTLVGVRRHEDETYGQHRSRGQSASKTPAKSGHERRCIWGANQRAGRQGCNRSGG